MVDQGPGPAPLPIDSSKQTYRIQDYYEYRRAQTLYVDPETAVDSQGQVTYSNDYHTLMIDAANHYGHTPLPEWTNRRVNVSSLSARNLATGKIAALQNRAKTDPDAVWALIDQYRTLSRKQLSKLAENDNLAAVVLDNRAVPNTVARRIASKQGQFSEPKRFFDLVDAIILHRKRININRRGRSVIAPDDPVQGGTVGASVSNIAGMQAAHIGASRNAGGEFNHYSEFKPATDFDAPLGSATHGHAEQQLADRLHLQLKEMDPASYDGKTIWMLIEQEPCSSCRQGLRSINASPGVLAKLSAKYPGITFEVRNLNDSSLEIIVNGRSIYP